MVAARKNDPPLQSGMNQSGPNRTAGTETAYCGGLNDRVWPEDDAPLRDRRMTAVDQVDGTRNLS